jgi:hypothetical protein
LIEELKVISKQLHCLIKSLIWSRFLNPNAAKPQFWVLGFKF